MQATDNIISANDAANKPVMIAPTMLVAANAMPRSKSAVRTVPIIPVSSAVILEHPQRLVMVVQELAVKKAMTKKPTAIPNATHKNAGATVRVPVMVKIAVAIPTIRLPITAKNVQSYLHAQFVFAIVFTSDTLYGF